MVASPSPLSGASNEIPFPFACGLAATPVNMVARQLVGYNKTYDLTLRAIMSTSLIRIADDHRALRPPQFGLRAMMLGVTFLCMAFALFPLIGFAGSAMLFLFASLIGLHVVGNVIGTRLRDSQHPTETFDAERPSSATVPSAMPAGRLQENTLIHWRWVIMALIGATVGGSAGGFAIATVEGAKLTTAGLCLGIGSSAVLGAFAGFMSSSLWTILRGAMREAEETMD
jgi:hypothetical protein